MNFVILIKSGHTQIGANSALNFTKAALQQGHHISQVFFYQDGTYLANNLSAPAQDEPNIYLEWATLAKEHGLLLLVCVAAAARRGILGAADAAYHQKSYANAVAPFSTGGLGQFMQAIIQADRVITFGG